MAAYITKKYEQAFKYMTESIERSVKLRVEVYEKYFGILMKRSNKQKTTVKIDCIGKVYAQLRDKNVKLSDETVKKLLHFICNLKGNASKTAFDSY